LVTNIVKEEFKEIESHDGGGLNLMVIRDTQTSRKLISMGIGGEFFLTFGFKDVFCYLQVEALVHSSADNCVEA
jgi:hypothetical protein